MTAWYGHGGLLVGVVAMSVSAVGLLEGRSGQTAPRGGGTVELYCQQRTVCRERTLIECLAKHGARCVWLP
jgi:hypothetical protein